ncbi:MAG: AAA family ATPase [Pirellulales bacterium]
MDLRAFGPFTSNVLDFGDEPDRLHIVYGPNEAGKSSALRALRQLLFGIDQRTDDDFVHKYGDLRIGAVLECSDGQRLECVRRKSLRDSLRGADDNEVIDPALLSRMLGGLSRELYEQMFGLNHEALVAGGRELADGQGALGQSLFAAGAGISELRRVQQELAAEAAALFKSGNATNPRINQSLRELHEARRALKDAQLPSTVWSKCNEAHHHTLEQKRQVDGQLAASRRERERLATIARAQPLVAASRQLRLEIAALGPLPVLDDEFSSRRRQAQADLTASQSAAALAESALADIDRQLTECEAPAELLAAADQIEELQRQLGSVLKADFDQISLRSQVEQAEAAAARRLRELRPDLDLAAAESLRLTRPQRERIQSLLVERASLTVRNEQAQQQLASLQARLAAAAATLKRQPTAGETTTLRRTISGIAKQGELEEQSAELARQIARLERQAHAELRKLFGWSGDSLAAEALVPPTRETVDAFEKGLRDQGERVARARDQLNTAATTADALRLQIEEMRSSNEPPSEAELATARASRDELWRLVRSWLRGETTEPSDRAGASHTAGLADDFEKRQARVDELSDQLRREADRAGQYARLQVQAREQQRLIESRERELETARLEEDRWIADWQALWRQLGVEPRQPVEMRGWLAQHERVVELCGRLRDEQQRAKQLDERIRAACESLAAALTSVGTVARDDRLTARLEHAEQVCGLGELQLSARKALESEICRLHSELPAVEQSARDAAERLTQWESAWAQALNPLGMPPHTTPEEATAVLSDVVDLFEQLDAAARDRQRVQAIERDRAAFEENVRELAARLALGSTDQPAQQVAAELRDRLTAARQLQERRVALVAERQREERKRRLAQQAVTALQQTLAELCRQAGCQGVDDLPTVERRVALGRDLAAKLVSIENQLREAAVGKSLDDIAAEVDSAEGTELSTRLCDLDDEIDSLEHQRDALAQALGATEAELKAMDGAPRAAEAAERAEAVRAALVGQVEQFARTRLAAAILREAIEKYRDKHQDPVLRRASQLFAAFTVGSFTGLRTEIGDDGQPLLVGVRPGSATHVGVAGMSEGTCDQLYLALRLASLEECLRGREPVPLVVDDILVNFDNERSVATLQVLADLARRTQVILFTHHEHLLDLAETALAPRSCRVHRLVDRSAPLLPQVAAAV